MGEMGPEAAIPMTVRILFDLCIQARNPLHLAKWKVYGRAQSLNTPPNSLPSNTHYESKSIWRAVPLGHKARGVFPYMKAPASQRHHEAKPRRETWIGQGPAEIL